MIEPHCFASLSLYMFFTTGKPEMPSIPPCSIPQFPFPQHFKHIYNKTQLVMWATRMYLVQGSLRPQTVWVQECPINI